MPALNRNNFLVFEENAAYSVYVKTKQAMITTMIMRVTQMISTMMMSVVSVSTTHRTSRVM